MRDKRSVDELSIEELEQILAIRKRDARMQQMQRMKRDGRVINRPTPSTPPERLETDTLVDAVVPSPEQEPVIATQDHTVQATLPTTDLTSGTVEPRFEDDVGISRPGKAKEPSVRTRQLMNQILLLVEVAAVLGLVFIGLNLIQAVRALERETEAAQELAEEQRRAGIPTIEPTPTIRWENIVLPSGHIYSNDGSFVDFNINEIPANLRPVVQSQLAQPVLNRPPPTEETALRIVIPKLQVDQAIFPGVDPGALRLGVGQLINGVDPGDREGNVVLAAHNDIYGEIFRYLDRLEPGDRFTIFTQIQAHEYVVATTDVVEPDDVQVMDSQPGRAMVTLISCYPFQVNTQRIVVFADRID